jgi:hypothetical protein
MNNDQVQNANTTEQTQTAAAPMQAAEAEKPGLMQNPWVRALVAVAELTAVVGGGLLVYKMGQRSGRKSANNEWTTANEVAAEAITNAASPAPTKMKMA